MKRIIMIVLLLCSFAVFAAEEPLELKVGWNLVSVPTAFKGVTTKVLFEAEITSTVWSWNPTLQNYASALEDPLSDRIGYWVYVDADKSIVFPTNFLKIVSPIEDVDVNEKQAFVNVDLSAVFADDEGSMVGITKTLVTPDTSSVVKSATINGDQLELTFAGEEPGTAGFVDLIIKAVKNDLEIVETVRVSLTPVDDAPTVTRTLPGVNSDEDDANSVISVAGLFSDVDNEDFAIVYSVYSNTNETLVSATLLGTNLILDYLPEQSGNARITVRGTSNGKSVDVAFDLVVNVVDDAPVIVTAIPVQQVDAGALPLAMDLTHSFEDVDNLDSAISLSVVTNSNAAMVTTSWQEKVLVLTFVEGVSGSANITVEALSGGKTGSHTFTVVASPFPTAEYVVIDISAGSDANSYPVTDLSSLPHPLPDEYKTTKIVLRKISKGIFTMGAPDGELGKEFTTDEIPHQVTVTQDYYVGVIEVTQKQYELVTYNWPAAFVQRDELGFIDMTSTKDDKLPVESVSWSTIRGGTYPEGRPSSESFMGLLREKSGLSFDLPTEAQWEFACRAGTVTALNSNEELTSATDEDVELGEVAWYRNNANEAAWGYPHVANSGTQNVAQLDPNEKGLYDMHGNVYEWCLDWYVAYDHLNYGGGTNPVGGLGYETTKRVYRGGGWSSYPWGCRSANRANSDMKAAWSFIGFRIALTPSLLR